MSADQNRQVVQAAYGAFARGDVAALLSGFDDDIVWHGVIGVAPHVPLSGVRRGRQQVAGYFATVAETLQFERFEPRTFVAEGDHVIVLGSYAATTNTGSRFESEWAMVFTFRNGRIAEFHEFCDSAALNRAFEPARV